MTLPPLTATYAERMHVVVAANPHARFGRAKQAGAETAARLVAAGHEVRFFERTSWDDLLSDVREACRAADALVVVGGDGMVHLAANTVAEHDLPFAIVPSGSGNDFAKTLGIESLDAAIEGLPDVLTRTPTPVDALRIRHGGGITYAAGIVSVGFDADVNRRSFDLQYVPSRVRYEAAIALTLANPRHRTFEVAFDDDEPFELATLIFAIANHQYFGGGIRIAPEADVFDGKLTTVWAEPLTRMRFYRLLTKALKGRHTGERDVHVRDVQRVALRSDEPVDAFADGERIGALPLEVDVRPGMLRVLR